MTLGIMLRVARSYYNPKRTICSLGYLDGEAPHIRQTDLVDASCGLECTGPRVTWLSTKLQERNKDWPLNVTSELPRPEKGRKAKVHLSRGNV